MDKICKKFPSPERIWFGPKAYALIHDAEDVESLLKPSNNLNKMDEYKMMENEMGIRGLITLDGKQIKTHIRSMLKVDVNTFFF